ncbi:ActS/PrrB/RegB family redox-sensitive histidine kinase [Paracoccus luteus]|uniref:ActS/PrrB/RegB family redox-sensitive histidine kinase n=1 Tax=Paracoccus luteus TaxID=2508543 RepID=UPI00107004C1|nr:ActS/PrrB/RegB family redox-sensitive histidine kinase [Paracoccus luteus]
MLLANRPPIAARAGSMPDPIRARTLTALRWVALAGQAAAVAGGLALGVDLPLGPVAAMIALSGGLNLWLTRRRSTRVTPVQAAAQLCLDAGQVGILLALVGGINNPFALFVLAPLTIAATALPARLTLAVGAVTAGMIALMTLNDAPLRMAADAPLSTGTVLTLAHVLALSIGGGFFALYAHRVASELGAASDALAVTGMALAREQRLQHLGGVVAAAAHEMGTPLATIKLIAAELADELDDIAADRPGLADDLAQLRRSADRCRDILRSMGQAGKDDLHLRRAPLAALLDEAAGPHRDRGRLVVIKAGDLATLSVRRDAATIHGLRNLIQNAVDFAAATVTLTAERTATGIAVTIRDDGPGYPAHLLGRLGEPFLTTRRGEQGPPGSYEGMGLGLFIARTLLERQGATVAFQNDGGALATVSWPIEAITGDDRAALGHNPAIPG